MIRDIQKLNLSMRYKNEWTSQDALVFGLSLDFKTRNKMLFVCLRWGVGGFFSLQYYYLLIIRLCTDFQLDAYPETCNKVCWWVVVVGGNMSI